MTAARRKVQRGRGQERLPRDEDCLPESTGLHQRSGDRGGKEASTSTRPRGGRGGQQAAGAVRCRRPIASSPVTHRLPLCLRLPPPSIITIQHQQLGQHMHPERRRWLSARCMPAFDRGTHTCDRSQHSSPPAAPGRNMFGRSTHNAAPPTRQRHGRADSRWSTERPCKTSHGPSGAVLAGTSPEPNLGGLPQPLAGLAPHRQTSEPEPAAAGRGQRSQMAVKTCRFPGMPCISPADTLGMQDARWAPDSPLTITTSSSTAALTLLTKPPLSMLLCHLSPASSCPPHVAGRRGLPLMRNECHHASLYHSDLGIAA
ncbi:hypothetical protein BCR34DRAFT_101603 [Clohesyomyces aquaticus]|uniref:Uncharacterized protein n=1 Tax=Clohesyomyces aquaticus TaxID=1231657 RepID=A0A1Y1YSK3_9PLEO|nr:hypothetical protein BCR34DRAFT_101603 [Clohesyomyces aquaticus]